MDHADFANTMQTIGWSTGATDGFEEVAYGAALSLIHYRNHLTPIGRQSWAAANNRLSNIGRSGIQRTKQGYFLSFINQLRLQTYGIAFDDQSVSHQSIIATTPWAQTDGEFQFSMNYINTRQIPDDKQFREFSLSQDERIVYDKVSSTLKKEALKYLERGAIAVGGGAVATFFKVKNATWVGVATDVVWEVLSSRVKELEKQDVIRRFKTDETRRKHLVGTGQSTYRATS